MNSSHIAYLCLGSNLGNRLSYLERAIETLHHHVHVSAISSVYETEPVEMTTEKWFYNIVVKTKTELQPNSLLNVTKQIEQELGRSADSHLQPREIDIDILLYENLEYHDENLHVPHPKLHMRRFALVPLCELAPTAIHPLFQKTVIQLLNECQDRSHVTRTTLNVKISEPV